MVEGTRGWWSAQCAAAAGDRYGYALDGGPVRPDPAARRLPGGVHDRAALVDPRQFRWSPQESGWRGAPLAGSVIYELHIGAFTEQGTLAAAAEHLQGLNDLGITHVELMPVNGFSGTRGWGYDGVAWYAVHEPYGGPEGLVAFVDAAHRAGLSVILDVVYNHLGPSGNYLPDFGPYLTDRYRTPWGDCLNLDGPGSDDVRSFVTGSALAWLRDYHLDGLRLDAVHGLIDTSPVHLLVELSAAVERLAAHQRRPLVLIAESDRADPRTTAPRALGGEGMDGQWADDLHHVIHTALTGEQDGYYVDYRGLVDLPATYRRGFLYDGRWSRFRGRTVGAPLSDDLPGWALVGCVQNHDQVGNRAAGDRLTTLVDPALAKVAVLLLCAAPHTPMLFMGEEYGETNPFLFFTSHPDPDLAEAVRTGRRAEFADFEAFAGVAGAQVPDPQEEQTFRRSVLDRSRAATVDGAAWRALWTDLLALRRDVPALGNGRRDLVSGAGEGLRPEQTAVVRRDPDGAAVLVVANLLAQPARCRVRVHPAETAWRPVLATTDARYCGVAGGGGGGGDPMMIRVAGEGLLEVSLPPRSGAIFTCAADSR